MDAGADVIQGSQGIALNRLIRDRCRGGNRDLRPASMAAIMRLLYFFPGSGECVIHLLFELYMRHVILLFSMRPHESTP